MDNKTANGINSGKKDLQEMDNNKGKWKPFQDIRSWSFLQITFTDSPNSMNREMVGYPVKPMSGNKHRKSGNLQEEISLTAFECLDVSLL